MLNRRLLAAGLVGWGIATLALRLDGARVLRPGGPLHTVGLFAVSFPAMAWIVRAACRRAEPRPEAWPAAAVAFLLPTLLLDPFSSAFFPVVFPDSPPAAAGLFGGWMLWCCAGGLVGATFGRAKRP